MRAGLLRGKHDGYRNPATGVSQAVPRHREIKDPLARRIIRILSNTDDAGAGSANG